MKKLLFLLLTLVLGVGTLFASDIEVNGIWYDFESYNNTATVTYKGSSFDSYTGEYTGVVNIPSSVEYNNVTYKVTNIGWYAFFGCKNLTSVTIPNSVTIIGERAFYDCSGLTSVTIPNSVTSIGWYAFAYCSGLTSVEIPNSVTEIGGGAFAWSYGLTSVTIPNSVTSIEIDAFHGCYGLSSIEIPNSVTSIGSEAFQNSGLTSIEIPNSVTSIGAWAFSDCSALTSIDIPNSVTSIGDHAFYGSGLTSVTLGNGITSIEKSVFAACHSLTSVTIPNSVTSIGDEAFSSCLNLTSVTIPNSVTSIGNEAFHLVPNVVYYGSATGSPWNARSVNGYVDGLLVYSNDNKTNLLACSAVANGEISIPNSVNSIGDWAFVDCKNLTSVTIPNSVTSIGLRAFYGCIGLISVEIPNSVTSIGQAAFDNIPNIVYNGSASGSPWSARSMNGYVDGLLVYSDAFKTNLVACSRAVIGGIDIPNSVTSIGEKAFEGCYTLTSIDIPNSVTTISSHAFECCRGLSSITIPNSVISIGDAAFFGCFGLNSITIGNNVTTIRSYAFCNCTGLTSIEIPNSVTSIGNEAFNNCSGLTSVTNYAQTPQTIENNVFYNVNIDNCKLYVPKGTRTAYTTADVWKDFGSVVEVNIPGEIEIEEGEYSISYFDKENVKLHNEIVTLHVPVAPIIEGFTFLKWQASGDLTNGIVLQAVYTANTPTEAPEVVVNPANPAQKLIRNGNVYILTGDKTYTITGQKVR